MRARSPADAQSNFGGTLPFTTKDAPAGTTSSFVMHTVLMKIASFALPLVSPLLLLLHVHRRRLIHEPGDDKRKRL